jgi:hypothetical protein
MVDDQPWMIVQEKVDVYDKSSGFVCCDRRLHLLIFNYEANKTASISSTNSTINISDHSSINNARSTRIVYAQTVSKSDLPFLFFFLEKIIC